MDLSQAVLGGCMQPMSYISADTVVSERADERGDAFSIPRGFNGLWKMTGRYKNFFATVEPEQ